jgi:hypothetical protein
MRFNKFKAISLPTFLIATMTKKNILKGVILVGLGAASYGMLATFVKLAYNQGYTTAEVRNHRQ